VEQLFECYVVSEENKVPLATLSFQGHALHWWTALVRDRRLHNEPTIVYWNDLKSALRRRHIPSYYHRELMDKLHRFNQKNMSIEEYRQKMELYMMRAGFREEENVTVARYLSGLSLEIRDRVELLPYRDFHDLVQICIKVEQQVLRKSTNRSSYSNSYSKTDHKREGKFLKEKPRENPPKVIVQENTKRKEEFTPSDRTSGIKCFKFLGRGHIQSQCPSMRTILMRGQDLYSSEEEKNDENTSEGSDNERGEDGYAHEGELLMMRRFLNSQPSPQPESQRGNIFHTRFTTGRVIIVVVLGWLIN